MKSNYIFKICLIALLVFTSSCLDDFDDLRVNPNQPTEVVPSLLFSQITPGSFDPFTGIYTHTQYSDQIGGVATQLNYVAAYRGSFNYGVFNDIESMINEAEKAQAIGYAPLGKFIKAINYFDMTRKMGDIPLSEALRLDEGIVYPKYDTQKSVLIQCLNWLDEANSELADAISNGASVDGDMYYEGNLNKWQKAINSFTLRTLIELSKKENDADLGVKTRFANIINNPSLYPLFESSEDDMQLEYRDEDDFRFTLDPKDNIASIDRTVLSGVYIDLLKSNNDPRLFEVADPTTAALSADPNAASDFNAYNGYDTSRDWGDLEAEKNAGLYSKPKESRYINVIGIPNVYLSYVEQEFTIAEAANRGWVSGAESHYTNAITSSMEFNGVDSIDILDFLNGNGKYLGDNSTGLTQILEQKYLGFFQNSGWESFFNQRRTGVPSYNVSENNTPSGKVPVRWLYPTAEATGDNPDNLKDALILQFGEATDDVDNLLWHLN